jgi:hypothetical protein
MRLTGIKVGDIVHADVRGQRFYAMVEQVDVEPVGAPGARSIQIGSLNGKALGYSRLTARQVLGHWRRAAGSQ